MTEQSKPAAGSRAHHPPGARAARRAISHRRRESGSAVIEFSLLAPWILFLFAALLDCGFYTSALIATQNAARVGALTTSLSPNSAGDASAAWADVLGEMRSQPNVNGSATCSGPAATCTDGRALTLSVSAVTGLDGHPASRVTVQYTTLPLIPLPFLAGQFTFRQQTEARVIPE